MKLMVIDGNSIVNRAFYGIRLLTTKDGTPTNAVYGFLTILQRMLNEENPDALCVTFDLRAPTFRHEKYAAYKAQRKGMPEDLAVQMPILKEVLDAMNIPRYELEGYEADDLIGTIAKKCEDAGWQCLAVTGDKDSFQLITEKTHIKHVKTSKGQTETKEYTPELFFEEYGFTPEKIVDLKALMGDSSDNIPGVAGVGEKTAMNLIQTFGTIEAIYSQLDTLDIKETLRTKLKAGSESAAMSYDLAEICRTAPLEFLPEKNVRVSPDNDKLHEVFTKLEFTKLIDRFALSAPKNTSAKTEVFEAECVTMILASDADAQTMFADITACEYVAVSRSGKKIIVVNDAKAYIITPEYEGYRTALSRLFSGEVKKAGHDVKDLMRRLIKSGYSTEGWVFDSALAGYLLEPTASDYAIARLTEKYCNFVPGGGAEEDGQLSLLADETAELAKILSETAAISCLYDALLPKLDELGMRSLFDEIEMPLCSVLAKMESEGFMVDKAALADFAAFLGKGIDTLTMSIYTHAGEEFNINSPRQLGVVLFEKLMLPAPKKTKTGWSTNIEVLEGLKGKHPIIAEIIEYRELSKLKSTYADGLVRFIGEDGRIRTSFQMTVTATGRLSSTEPNLQNIPIRKELGGEIRKMFVAKDGCVLVDADYSQIELRLLAHIADDKTMQDAFKSGEDIHRVTASQVFDVPLEEVTPFQRSSAKAVNFGIVYGISQYSLSQDIGVSVAEAKQYMDNYFNKYHGVRDYMKNIVVKAKEDGFVRTEFGRMRWLPELKSSNFNLRAFGERVALNAPIQGTAADIMKLAMIRVSNRLEKEQLRARLILQVHDELIVECPTDEVETVKHLLCEEMENVASLSVPLTAEAGSGKSWYSAK